MKKDEELIVITKTYDLIPWSCNHTSQFPRNHRFVLGERIERNRVWPMNDVAVNPAPHRNAAGRTRLG